MIGNFLVRSALKFSQEHSKSSQKRLKSNRERTKIRQPNGNLQIHRPKQSININDRFTRISTIVYCITCTLRKKILTGETERKFADRFREHLRDVEKKKHNSNRPNHPSHNMTICGLSSPQHQGNTESRKTLQQRLSFQLGVLSPHGINERFRSTNLFFY